MIDYNGNKGFRLLNIYEMLNKGDVLSKSTLALHFNVAEKTIQRDIDDLRNYLADTHFSENEVLVKYDRTKGGYYLVRMEREWLTNQEVIAICKVLLESRAFCKDELNVLLEKLLSQVSPKSSQLVKEIIQNEKFHYVPLKHNKHLLNFIWELSEFIHKNETIQIFYTRKDGVDREHLINPVAIMFSEYYFYLIAFMSDGTKDFPTVFRIDRIGKFSGTGEKFYIPYKDKFSDGEFRNRVQFMFSGELQKVKFEYSGASIESVLDRLPTAKIISENDGIYTVEVEVYGNGIDMWLRSQGKNIKII